MNLFHLIGNTYITILRWVWIAFRLECESSALLAVHEVSELDHFICSEGGSAYCPWEYLFDIQRNGYLTSAHAQSAGRCHLLQIDGWSSSQILSIILGGEDSRRSEWRSKLRKSLCLRRFLLGIAWVQCSSWLKEASCCFINYLIESHSSWSAQSFLCRKSGIAK